MKNLELLKEEYIEFINKFNEIDTKIAYVVAENKEIPYDTLFFYFIHPEYESWKEDDEAWQRCNKTILQKKYEMYKRSIDKAVKIRNELFEEKYKLSLEFEQWKMKADLTYKEIRSFGDVERISIKWRGWDSSNYVYETMIHSINLTDEEEVNKIIANMEKVVSMIKSEDECDYCESIEYIDYLRIVNNETRYRLNEYCMTTLALDVMENHDIYNSYRESFKECILNISHLVDREFLFYAQHTQSLN